MAARNYFSHTTPEGVTFDQRIKTAGYPQPGAENIAKGQRSAQQVMNDWMGSDGHRRNIENCHGSVVRHPIEVESLAPDIEAPWTIEAYRAGRDPAMDAIAAALR